MNFTQHWKDAKSRAKAMSGVEAVKKGFFGGTGIGKSLEKLAKAAPAKRVAAAKDVIKAFDAYFKPSTRRNSTTSRRGMSRS
jgi:hypothetical protein